MRKSCKLHSLVPALLYLAISVHVSFAADCAPAEEIFLNCGASSSQTYDSDGRRSTPDVRTKFVLANSLTETASTQDPSVSEEVPYMTARIFLSKSSYSFPVTPGRKFVPLYFYPNSYEGLNASNGIFSLTSGEYTLLNNFSAAQTVQALNFAFMVKEYSLNKDSTTLNTAFTPSSNSYAFVSGIEVVSMPGRSQ